MKNLKFSLFGLRRKGFYFLLFLLPLHFSNAQTEKINLQDLSAFDDPAHNWKIVGNVYADLDHPDELQTTSGNGILVNDSKRKNPKDLVTEEEYKNIDLELDYMMAPGSNSGIYFMGDYELQLKDSWGFTPVTSAENGGIYERWDKDKPEGQNGYQGYPPRQNVSRAPGLWQHLEVSFQAPRFNEEGEKIENARFIYVKLNGVTIHEDVELFGPTRGSLSNEEEPAGPLRFQGDHGAVAFRNIDISKYDKPRPVLKDLEYKVYAGKFLNEPNLNNLPPEFEGKSALLTSDLREKLDQFAISYTGKLDVKEEGKYSFNLNVPGGKGLLTINNDQVIPLSGNEGKGTVELPAGELSFELLYSKFQDWVEPGLGLSISGDGIKEYLLSDASGDFEDPVDPILLEADSPKVFRSFMDVPEDEDRGGHRFTHAVSVGDPQQLHYTYDMNKGSIVQLWRGKFLDVTPMWYSRGNGSSRPIGSILHLSQPELSTAKLSSAQQAWPVDTTGTGYTSLGYRLDENELPTFLYSIYNREIEDKTRLLQDARGVQRTISIDMPGENLFVRLVDGKKIEKISDDLFLIGDKEFYIRLDKTGKSRPVLRGEGQEQELLVPLENELVYSLLM